MLQQIYISEGNEKNYRRKSGSAKLLNWEAGMSVDDKKKPFCQTIQEEEVKKKKRGGGGGAQEIPFQTLEALTVWRKLT